MIIDTRLPNDKVQYTYQTETIVVKYTPNENLHLKDFIKLFFEFKKIKKFYETFTEASRPR